MENIFWWEDSNPEISGRVEDFEHHFDFVDKAKILIESILGKKVELSFPKAKTFHCYEGAIDEEDLKREIDDPKASGVGYESEKVKLFVSEIKIDKKEYRDLLNKL